MFDTSMILPVLFSPLLLLPLLNIFISIPLNFSKYFERFQVSYRTVLRIMFMRKVQLTRSCSLSEYFIFRSLAFRWCFSWCKLSSSANCCPPHHIAGPLTAVEWGSSFYRKAVHFQLIRDIAILILWSKQLIFGNAQSFLGYFLFAMLNTSFDVVC